VKALLTEKMEDVRTIANALLEKEVLYKDDLEKLIGKRPFEEPVEETQDSAVLAGEPGPEASLSEPQS
jgi:cell division protease FtsH